MFSMVVGKKTDIYKNKKRIGETALFKVYSNQFQAKKTSHIMNKIGSNIGRENLMI